MTYFKGLFRMLPEISGKIHKKLDRFISPLRPRFKSDYLLTTSRCLPFYYCIQYTFHAVCITLNSARKFYLKHMKITRTVFFKNVTLEWARERNSPTECILWTYNWSDTIHQSVNWILAIKSSLQCLRTELYTT